MSRTILITGATSGIGKALAYEMARRGYTLGLAARREEQLHAIREDIHQQSPTATVVCRRMDVTDFDTVPGAVNQLAEDMGGLDILFANAGIGLGERIGRGDFEKARKTIAVNLTGAIATVDAAVTLFLQAGGGHVVGVSSVAAWRGFPRGSVYSATKAGLAVYLETLRAELYRKNIQVTVLYPGYIDTPLNDMLPSRPFLITVEKGAAIIADRIEQKTKSAFVPAWPWAVVARILRLLPASVLSKM